MKNIVNKIFSVFTAFALVFNMIAYFLDTENEAGLNWESDIITVSDSGVGSYVAYPRMYTLACGKLICAFERDGNMVCKTSADDGLTWDEDEILIAHFDGLICTNAAFVLLASGELLCAYRANGKIDGKFYSSVRVSSSTDDGKSWKAHSTVIEALQKDDGFYGVWEPHFGFIGDTLAVFYANDSLGDAVLSEENQNIEFKLWDGTSWGEKHIASSGADADSRDGMPVWCRLSCGEYIMAIESTHLRNSKKTKRDFVIRVYTSSDGMNWGGGEDIYITSEKSSGTYAGAPYIVELPDGRLCVSFQTNETSSSRSNTARVMTSRKPYGGRINRFSFTKPFAPFGDDGSSCWNGMLIHNNYLLVFTTKSTDTGSQILLKRSPL